jgi:hypothetical protein
MKSRKLKEKFKINSKRLKLTTMNRSKIPSRDLPAKTNIN